MSNGDSLDKLLAVSELHSLYLSLGVATRNDIDLENTTYSLAAARNSISLLKAVGLIGIRFGRYLKKDKSRYTKFADFKSELKKRLHEHYSKQINSTFKGTIRYDDERSLYYLKRNSIDLHFSGLLMLLDGVGAISLSRTDVFISDYSLIESYKNPALLDKRISIIQLKDGLIIKDRLGAEAEKLALVFEQDLLDKQNIRKNPTIISAIDVAAGYDIVSYLTDESLVPDKFIEVKSCKNHDYHFYMSKNEIETARIKGESYFLYLYNRVSEQFRIVKSPYGKVFSSDEWAKDPQIFEVHSIG